MPKVKQKYEKLFYDLNTAKQFGVVIDAIAETITVPAGRVGKPYKIFNGPFTGSYEDRGNHFYIRKDIYPGRERFYVGYHIESPRGSALGDMVKAKRHADTYLNQKYQELTGSSLER